MVSGAKVDLSSQISKSLQLGGSWLYNKKESSFSLNTAIIADAMIQDSSFIAGTYHGDGKLESRGMLKMGYGFSGNGEIMFQGPDVRRAYYAIELSRAFDNFVVGGKYGTGMRAFSYMQRLTDNIYAGFECTYLVLCVLYLL